MEKYFFTSKGFEEIGKDIYVYKNFLNENELKDLIKTFDEVRDRSLFEPSMVGTHFENRISVPLKDLEPVLQKARDLIGEDFGLHNNTSINVMREGDSWGQHSDNHDFLEKRNQSLLLKEGDPYEIIQDTRYGMVVYFNKVKSGGELYYSAQNITYSPAPGDMVIHSAEENCIHGVNKVLSGSRYSYSNFLSRDMRVPKK
jgi:hypothetical protein